MCGQWDGEMLIKGGKDPPFKHTHPSRVSGLLLICPETECHCSQIQPTYIFIFITWKEEWMKECKLQREVSG